MRRPETFTFEDDFQLETGDFVVEVPSGVVSKQHLLEVLFERGRFPGYFGFNWDALFDCMTDWSGADGDRVVVLHSDVPALPEAERRVYLQVLADAFERLYGVDGMQLLLVFPSRCQKEIDALLDGHW